MAEMMYYYIFKAETVFLRMYKTNPYEIIKGISLLDLNAYLTNIKKEVEAENKGRDQKSIMSCLKSISDYLNVMFYMK